MFSKIVLCEKYLYDKGFLLDTLYNLALCKNEKELTGMYFMHGVVSGLKLDNKGDNRNLVYLRKKYSDYLDLIKDTQSRSLLVEMIDSSIYDEYVFAYIRECFGSLDVRFDLVKRHIIRTVVNYLFEIERCLYEPDYIINNYGSLMFSFSDLADIAESCDYSVDIESGLVSQWHLLDDSIARRGFIHYVLQLFECGNLYDMHNNNCSFKSYFEEDVLNVVETYV